MMGKSRSATIVIAYIMNRMKYTYEEAYKLVKSARSIIFPNMGFVKQLKQYNAILYENAKKEDFKKFGDEDNYVVQGFIVEKVEKLDV